MRTALCDAFGIEHPIFAFTPSEHVAAAVSPGRRARRARLRAVQRPRGARADADVDGRQHRRQAVRRRRRHADEDPDRGHVGRPAGDDPRRSTSSFVDETLQQARRAAAARGRGPRGRARLAALGGPLPRRRRAAAPAGADRQRARLAAGRRHRAGPRRRREGGRARRCRQARASHVANGVDIIVAQGYEAGGHTGEIASMVLTPEIVDAVGPDVPVLGAGGIGSGRQIAASLALGAQGVWTGSIWLDHRGVPHLGHQRRACRDAFLRATLRRHRPHPRSTPASRRGCSRPSGPRRGPRRTRPTRCRCRCRTCSSPTPTTGSTPPATPTWSPCRSARSSAG